MSVLENFKNIPRSPSHRATGPKCNFFSSNLQRSPWRKKKGACRPPDGRQGPVAHPWGDRGLSPVEGATGALGGAHMVCRRGDVCRAQATSQLWRGKGWQFSSRPGKQKKRGCHCGSMEPVTAFRLFVLLSGNDLWWGLEPVTAGSACLFLLRILFRSQILHPNTQIHHIECLDTYIKY